MATTTNTTAKDKSRSVLPVARKKALAVPKTDKPTSSKTGVSVSDGIEKAQDRDKGKFANDRGLMRHVCGSKLDAFNQCLLADVHYAQYLAKCGDDQKSKDIMLDYAAIAMRGFAPQDEVEDMMAAQAVGLHAAAMESMRRAMIKDQPHNLRMDMLNAANKLAGTYARIVEVLDKRRGKSGQKVTVEHVHVHQGGQAIVGNIEAGGGSGSKSGGQPYGQD